MAASAVTGPLQVNSAGDARALALKVFSGELLVAFERASTVKPTLMKKTIGAGKTAQFPAFGRVDASFHVRGENILEDGSHLKQINTVERTISVDELLTSSVFVPGIDEMLAHYDTRSPYAVQLGESLSRTYDQYAIRQIARAARTNTTTDSTFIPTDLGNSQGGGGFIGSSSITTGTVSSANGSTMLDHLHQAAKILDDKHVPREGRYVAIPPYLYWSLVLNKDILNRDYGGEQNGVFFRGTAAMAAGFMLVETTNIPSDTKTTNDAGEINDYRGDNSGLIAVAYHMTAAGSLWRLEPTLDMDADRVDYQGTLMVAKLLAGTGRLRPEAAVEISADASQPNLLGT